MNVLSYYFTCWPKRGEKEVCVVQFNLLLPHRGCADEMLVGRKFGQTGAWAQPKCVRMKQEHNRFVGRFFVRAAALLLNLLFIKDARRERKKSRSAEEKNTFCAAQRQLILHVALSARPVEREKLLSGDARRMTKLNWQTIVSRKSCARQTTTSVS